VGNPNHSLLGRRPFQSRGSKWFHLAPLYNKGMVDKFSEKEWGSRLPSTVKVEAVEVDLERVPRSSPHGEGLCALTVIQPGGQVTRIYCEKRALLEAVRAREVGEGPLPVRGDKWNASGKEAASLEVLAETICLHDEAGDGRHRSLEVRTSLVSAFVHLSDEMVATIDSWLEQELAPREARGL
jgi:hypothetical protein